MLDLSPASLPLPPFPLFQQWNVSRFEVVRPPLCWVRSWVIFGVGLCLLGCFFRCLRVFGGVLGCFWVLFGVISGFSGVVLAVCGGRPRFFLCLECFGVFLGVFLGVLGGCFGGVLGVFWGSLGVFGGVLGVFWAVFGRFRPF